MSNCNDYPTPDDSKRFKKNADSVNEYVTSNKDTFTDQDGDVHLTMTGIRNSFDPPNLSGNNGASLVGTKSGSSVQSEIDSLRLSSGAGVYGYASVASMNADLSPKDQSIAYVTNDPIPTNNGTYRKAGASGVGSWVQSSDDLASQAYQKATFSADRIELSDQVSTESHQNSSSDDFSLISALGELILKVDQNGVLDSSGGFAERAKEKLIFESNSDSKMTISTTLGEVILDLDKSGRLNVIGLNQNVKEISATGKVYSNEVNQVLLYGQSLSVGSGENLDPSQVNGNLMFTKGVYPQRDFSGETPSEWYSDLIPLSYSAGMTQSYAKRITDRVLNLITVEDGINPDDQTYKMLPSCPGFGGVDIAQLSKGGQYYNTFMEHVTYGKSLSSTKGMIHGVTGVFWVQGEADQNNSPAYYEGALSQLISDVNNDVGLITGESESIPFISYQTYPSLPDLGNGATLGQYSVMNSGVKYTIVTPIYHLHEYGSSDPVHLNRRGYDLLGEYLALGYKRIVIDGEDWKPLHPTSVRTQGRLALITLHVPYPPLSIDSDMVKANDFGFTVHNDSGAVVPILSVTITSANTIKIELSENFLPNYEIRYALDPTVSDVIGNIRDCQGDAIKAKTGERLDNFLISFTERV